MTSSSLRCRPGASGGVRAALVAVALIGCGGVTAPAVDGAVTDGGEPDVAPDANPCAPNPCVLLSDELNGASINTALWGVATGGGATVTQQNGAIRIRVPAAAEAWADLFSRTSFPVGTTLEAAVTFSGGQFYDHKGMGFASSRIGADCFQPAEMDAAMFRGQDGDSYTETRSAGTASCRLTLSNYPGGAHTLRVTRAGDQVLFRQNGTQLPAARDRVPTSPLPVRFSVYTYSTAPAQAVQLDIDWVLVTRP